MNWTGLWNVTYNELPFFETDAMSGTHEHEIVWFILRRIFGLVGNTVAMYYLGRATILHQSWFTISWCNDVENDVTGPRVASLSTPFHRRP